LAGWLYSELDCEEAALTQFERLATRDFADFTPADAATFGAAPAQTCVFLGDKPRAALLYNFLLPRAGLGTGQVAFMGAADLHLGMLASLLSRWVESERHFRDALAFHERMGARPWTAHTQYEYGRMLMARGRRGDSRLASHLLERAFSGYAELSLDLWARETEALLKQKRLALHAGGVAHPDHLTGREVEVLRLIATGKTNREIGTALFLSVRTVERHIANIYGKTNARGRAEATAYALRQGLVPMQMP